MRFSVTSCLLNTFLFIGLVTQAETRLYAQIAAKDSVWNLGIITPYADYKVHKQGEEYGAHLTNGAGIAGGNTSMLGAYPIGIRWVSTLLTGVFDSTTQNFSSAGNYKKTGIGKIRESFLLYSLSPAWITTSASSGKTALFFGPTVEFNHFDVDVYLVDSPSRSEGCKQAVNSKEMQSVREHCTHVTQVSDTTTLATHMGFVAFDDATHLVISIDLQSLGTEVTIKKEGFKTVRTPKPVIYIGYGFEF